VYHYYGWNEAFEMDNAVSN